MLRTGPQNKVTNKRTVTPAKAGVQNALKGLDSGFRRNDERDILDTHLCGAVLSTLTPTPSRKKPPNLASATVIGLGIPRKRARWVQSRFQAAAFNAWLLFWSTASLLPDWSYPAAPPSTWRWRLFVAARESIPGLRVPAPPLMLSVDTKSPESSDQHIIALLQGLFDELKERAYDLSWLSFGENALREDSFDKLRFSERRHRGSFRLALMISSKTASVQTIATA
jgi:hypothetical protein